MQLHLFFLEQLRIDRQIECHASCHTMDSQEALSVRLSVCLSGMNTPDWADNEQSWNPSTYADLARIELKFYKDELEKMMVVAAAWCFDASQLSQLEKLDESMQQACQAIFTMDAAIMSSKIDVIDPVAPENDPQLGMLNEEFEVLLGRYNEITDFHKSQQKKRAREEMAAVKLTKMYHPNKRQKSLTTEICCRTTLVPKMHRVCYMCGEWPEYQCKRCNKPFCFECGYTLKDKETGKFFTACDPCIIDTDFPDDVERLVVAKTFWLC
jgi:hypothetical protein